MVKGCDRGASSFRVGGNHRVDRTGGRHTGFKAVSTGQGKQQDRPTSRIPSPLMGEESKSLSQCLTLGSEGENDATHRPVIADLIRNPEGQGGHEP